MFIISTSSSAKVFHRYGCPYTYRIANEHYQEIRTKTAKKYGLRPCKCCASMPQRDICDEAILRGCCRKAGFFCKYEPSTQCFFLRTDFGFWKLMQSSSGDYLLYHSSAFDPALPFDVQPGDTILATELSRLCDVSYPTIYKYLRIVKGQ